MESSIYGPPELDAFYKGNDGFVRRIIEIRGNLIKYAIYDDDGKRLFDRWTDLYSFRQKILIRVKPKGKLS